MKKVLHIISQRPSDTGSGVYLQNLIRNGLTDVNQAIVFAANKDDEIEIDIAEEMRYDIRFETERLPFSVVGMSDVMPYRSSVFSQLNNWQNENLLKEYKLGVKNAILNFKPDIIFAQHLWLLTSITKLLVDELALNIPVYGFCHGTDLRQLMLSKEHGELAVLGCKNLNGVFVLNKFQADEVEKLYAYDKKNIHVLGNGYNSTYFYNNLDLINETQVKERIIYAGKLSESKGVSSLLRAFKLLDRDKYELYIAGSGYGEEYKKILDEINALDNVFYLGKISQEQLGDEFRKSDIFVLPSFYEGLPLVIIEAIACGLKVVCTDINGIKEWINQYVNTSEIISFVKLPKMIDVDKPDLNGLDEFERNISKAILEKSNADISNFNYDLIHELKWTEIFKKLKKII